MQRDHHREIERNFAAVVADQPAAGVDLAGVELGHELDAAFLEHPAELAGGDRLREGSVEWRRVGDLHLVAHAALGEVPISQEAELERRDGALDRHVDDVDDEPAAVEGRERGTERARRPRVCRR